MTVKQKQCLLAFFGCYEGEIDGVWGDLSRQGTVRFQVKTGLKEDGVFGEETEAMARKLISGGAAELPGEDDWWSGIRWFRREEFACKCGGKYCDGYPAEMRREVVEICDQLRSHFGVPVTVVSGLRCRRHNAACGGTANSQHMYGEAVDIRVQGVSQAEVEAYLDTRTDVRYHYPISGSRNVHFDIPKGAR